MKKSTVAEQRQDRVHSYADMDNGINATATSFSEIVAKEVANNEAMASFDSLLAEHKAIPLGEQSSLSLDSLVSGAMIDAEKAGFPLTPASFDAALQAAQSILENADLDSINDASGAIILASFIKLNIFQILSASIPFTGDVSGIESTGGSGSKFQIVTITPVVTRAMGDLEVDDCIDGSNSGSTFAFTERTSVMVAVNGATPASPTVYTFNLRAKNKDANNAKMERGVNSVTIGVLEIQDFDITTNEAIGKRQVTHNGITYDVSFNYNAGTIVLTLSKDIAVGTKIYFSSALSAKALGDATGVIGSEAIPNIYIGKAVAIDTSTNTLQTREMQKVLGYDSNSTELMMAMSKISEEAKANKLRLVHQMATPYGITIDIASATENTITARYKRVLVEIEKARTEITTQTGLTSNIVIVGGIGLVEVYASLSSNEGKTGVINQGSETGFRKLGVLNDNIEVYFDPNYDATHPVVNGVHTFSVIGNPSDSTRRAVISGVGVPLMPVDLGTDSNSNKKTRIEGKLVISANKAEASKRLVRQLSVKLA